MTAQDYKVNFPYGATSPPYSPASAHRGDDHPCPEGTPLVIGGVQLGLTGHTGKAIGAHLHIQEWKGDYANTRKPQNAFKPGTVTNVDLNGTQGDGSFGKFITIQASDGWNDSYCHLSQINVKVGQKIGVVSMDHEDVNRIFRLWQRDATQAELDYWIGKKPETLAASIYNDPANDEFRRKAVNYDKDIAAAAQTQYTEYNGEQLFTKKK